MLVLVRFYFKNTAMNVRYWNHFIIRSERYDCFVTDLWTECLQKASMTDRFVKQRPLAWLHMEAEIEDETVLEVFVCRPGLWSIVRLVAGIHARHDHVTD